MTDETTPPVIPRPAASLLVRKLGGGFSSRSSLSSSLSAAAAAEASLATAAVLAADGGAPLAPAPAAAERLAFALKMASLEERRKALASGRLARRFTSYLDSHVDDGALRASIVELATGEHRLIK